jgi:NitT/TauT family transport system ATP-binding protein
VTTLISLSSISKQFSNGTLAVRDVNLDLASGEFVSLLGPSGCGKSTLLRMIAGLGEPSSGTIAWPGSAASGNHASELGFVFQEPTLMPWATVFANVYLPLKLTGVSEADASPRVLQALARVGLGDFANAYPRQLSGGMRMRVSIARALVTEPRVLLMDEPFAALDAQTREILQEELLQLMERPDERKTMVFITHSIDEAILLGDRIAVMSARPGRIKEVLDMPFGWPRVADAVRADPRFTEFRLHIWHQLHTAKPRRATAPREVA